MAKRNIFNQNLTLFLGLAVLALAFWINLRYPRSPLVISKQESATNVSVDMLKLTSLGNKRLFSSVLWIMTLIESDTEHYSKRDLGNWMFMRFRAIAKLDPGFYENYLWGGMLLSISKDDLVGAENLLDLGLGLFPSDYRLNYLAGFNAYFEMGDYEKGIRYFENIQDHPEAPTGLKFIINKLRHETGQGYETTFEFLKRSYESTNDENLKRKLFADLYALKAQKDLKCLNEGGSNCEGRDLEGTPYARREGVWVAEREFREFKIFRK